jgi:membrane protease YdiL (CAAX protease family)
MEPCADVQAPLPVVVPFRRRGQPLLAWLVILALVALVVWSQFRRSAQEPNEADSAHRHLLLELQARILVGTAAFQGKSAREADPTKQVEALNHGSGFQRLAAAVIAGELLGPDAARGQLAALPAHVVSGWTPEEVKLRNILLRLYKDYAAASWTAPSLDDAERAMLREELGWFGELALAPPAGPDEAARAAVLAPARRVALVAIIVGVGFVVVAAAGLIALFLWLVFLSSGRLRTRFQTGSPAGPIYAETFALWMALFAGLSLLVRWLHLAEYGILLVGLPVLGSLLALAWPVFRGYTWRQVRQEIGLTWRAGDVSPPVTARLAELAFGLVTYAMALPLLVVGLLVMLLLMRLQHSLGAAGPVDPSDLRHPIVDVLLQANGWQRAQLFILACVLAPLVEETMFRGVLYRHLREGTCQLSARASALLSATVVSFLFAVIHPQGFLGIPALMALAYAFALAREWRGTLLPAMIAHGLNNGVAFTIFLLFMSG